MNKKPEPKPAFLERMKEIFNDEEDYNDYIEILKHEPVRSFRCNKIKISPSELKSRLEKKYSWKISIPFSEYPEIMIVDSELSPGELGRSLEHLLGYYYIQEIASMLPVIALKPKPHEKVLDLCAAPGSKTTQMSAEMENKGLIIANDPQLSRVKILASNLERCGVTNSIITRNDGIDLCEKFLNENIKFDKILVDAPCSGEGTMRSSPKTAIMWNPNTIKKLSKLQMKLFERAFNILKLNGTMIYSTCTHAPEEDEEVVSYMLEKFKDKIKIERIELPKELNPRQGLTKWRDKEYLEDVKYTCRIYPHDSNTEGFFLSKFTKIKE